MYFTDPFQFTAASYRLAGMLVESQMRVMLNLTDATFGGKNPLLTPPVARRAVTSAPKAKPGKPQVARVVKTRPVPEGVTPKRRRQPSVPPTMPTEGAAALPAE